MYVVDSNIHQKYLNLHGNKILKNRLINIMIKCFRGNILVIKEEIRCTL